MVIRQIFKEETSTVYSFIKYAFMSAYTSVGTEHDYASSLRKSDKYIPTLELVAEDGGRIVGHIMATKFDFPFDVPSVIIGPVCVDDSYRNKGLGRSLVDVVCEKAKELGYSAAFVAGEPKFFSKVGFKPSTDFGLKNSDGIEDQFVQCKELNSGSLDKAKGEFSIQ